MRRSLLVVSLCALFLGSAAAPLARAQPPAQAQPGGRRFDVESRLAELRARLSLDAAQVQQVRAILEDAKRQVDALRASDAPPRSGERREQLRTIVFQTEDRIWALLNCTQKDAFRLYVREQLVQRFDHGGHGHGHGHGGEHR